MWPFPSPACTGLNPVSRKNTSKVHVEHTVLEPLVEAETIPQTFMLWGKGHHSDKNALLAKWATSEIKYDVDKEKKQPQRIA